MSEVRLAIDRAIEKLINRFGNTSDVIGELRGALAALDKEEAKAGETKADTPARVEVSPADEEPEYRRDKAEVTGEKAEPPPTKTPRKRSTGKGKK